MLDTLVLFAMIFCHITDDFYLQGIMKDMKQKDWWRKQTTDKKYDWDYLVVLLLHGFSWTFMIHLPVVVYGLYVGTLTDIATHLFLILFTLNWLIHVIIDDTKANAKKINLVIDQSVHVIQVVLTWLIYISIL